MKEGEEEGGGEEGEEEGGGEEGEEERGRWRHVWRRWKGSNNGKHCELAVTHWQLLIGGYALAPVELGTTQTLNRLFLRRGISTLPADLQSVAISSNHQ